MNNYNVTTTDGKTIQLVARNVFEAMNTLFQSGKEWVVIQKTRP